MYQRLTSKMIEEMRDLRLRGHSLFEISNEIHIAKSTASRYVGKILPLAEYKADLVQKRGAGSKKRKESKQKKSLEEANTLIPDISQKEKLLFLSALYWAEGNKKDFSLSNTDPLLIKVFVESMREIFHIPEHEFRVSVRIYEDLDKEACLTYWSGVTGIPKESFVNINILKGKKVGKLKYGMCRIRITKGGDILKKIMAINKTVASKFN